VVHESDSESFKTHMLSTRRALKKPGIPKSGNSSSDTMTSLLKFSETGEIEGGLQRTRFTIASVRANIPFFILYGDGSHCGPTSSMIKGGVEERSASISAYWQARVLPNKRKDRGV